MTPADLQKLRRGTDATVIQRLLAIDAQQDELSRAIAKALDGPLGRQR